MSDTIDEPAATSFVQTAKDLGAGAAGGIAQVLIGQPFDIVKVRLQTSTQYTSALSCARQIYTHEGASAFYKGTLTPLIGIGACVSVQFGAFHTARRFFESRNLASSSSPTLSLTQFYAAGAFAGVTNSVLSCPIEHVRIRLQTQPHAPTPAARLYTSPWSCISTLSSRGGLAHGLFKGQAVTVLREAQAYGCWFLTYEYLMAWDAARRGIERKEMEAWRMALYGGLAGEALWIGSFPFDVVKSRMQTDGLGLSSASAIKEGATAAAEKGAGEASAVATREALILAQLGTQKYASMRDCFAQVWRNEGMGGFWKGIGPTLLRAMPVSGATFLVAELTLRAIS